MNEAGSDLAPPCRLCGHENEPDARFCSSCGTHLEPDIDAPTQSLATLLGEPGGSAVEIVVVAGHRAGARYPVEGEKLTIGRHPESDIFLDDVTVSRRHVEMLEGPTGYTLRDSGSLNGTYINGTRITEEVTLASGDEMQVGKFRLLYVVSSVGL